MSNVSPLRLGERFGESGPWRALTTESTVAELQASAKDVDSLVLTEAALLDAGQLTEWLDLFTDDAVYWMPLNFDGGALRDSISLVYDSKRLMEDRVNRLGSGTVPSQDPLSRSVRVLGGRTYAASETVAEEGMAQCLVQVPFALFEQRGDISRQYGGWFRYLIRNTGESLRLVGKRVQLLNSDKALPNLTFIP